MPYKNAEKQRGSQREYYLKNKKKYAANIVRRRKEYKEWFLGIKRESKCLECGNDNPIVLDHHHTDPSIKEGTLARMVNDLLPKEKILKEIAKCIVLCSNCHRILHYNEKD